PGGDTVRMGVGALPRCCVSNSMLHMRDASRHVLAILAGLAIVMVGAFLVDAVGLYLYPVPQGLSMREIVSTRILPARVFNFVLPLLVCVIGAFVAAWLVPEHGRRNALVVAGLLVAFVLASAASASSPLWFTIGSVVLFPICAVAGVRLARA